MPTMPRSVREWTLERRRPSVARAVPIVCVLSLGSACAPRRVLEWPTPRSVAPEPGVRLTPDSDLFVAPITVDASERATYEASDVSRRPFDRRLFVSLYSAEFAGTRRRFNDPLGGQARGTRFCVLGVVDRDGRRVRAGDRLQGPGDDNGMMIRCSGQSFVRPEDGGAPERSSESEELSISPESWMQFLEVPDSDAGGMLEVQFDLTVRSSFDDRSYRLRGIARTRLTVQLVSNTPVPLP